MPTAFAPLVPIGMLRPVRPREVTTVADRLDEAECFRLVIRLPKDATGRPPVMRLRTLLKVMLRGYRVVVLEAAACRPDGSPLPPAGPADSPSAVAPPK